MKKDYIEKKTELKYKKTLNSLWLVNVKIQVYISTFVLIFTSKLKNSNFILDLII